MRADREPMTWMDADAPALGGEERSDETSRAETGQACRTGARGSAHGAAAAMSRLRCPSLRPRPHYASYELEKRCRETGIVALTGSVGECRGNAMAESFFATLGCDLIDRRKFPARTEVRMASPEYIEGWHNPHHRHSGCVFRPRLPITGQLREEPPTSGSGSRRWTVRANVKFHNDLVPFVNHGIDFAAIPASPENSPRRLKKAASSGITVLRSNTYTTRGGSSLEDTVYRRAA